MGNWGHALSIGELEVRDTAGDNLALVSRGAGVQVSSTYYGYGMDRFTQDMLWPLQYDLGFKWTRMDIISLYNETFQTGRIDWDCNLVRNAFSVDPISPAQPQPVYYVLRSISTVLDGFEAAEFAVTFSGE